jgi:hypothetical protein
MGPTVAAVHGKARAFVESLTHMPRSTPATAPHGHFARDYNTLRQLALKAAPGLDERLLGKHIGVYDTPGGEFSQVGYVEIEGYARQIVEQLALLMNLLVAGPDCAGPVLEPGPVTTKAYDVTIIRKEYCQAYAPWSEQDDEYLRSRFLEGATLADLVSEFGRQPGGIRARLRKLGLMQSRGVSNPGRQESGAEPPTAEERPNDQPARSVPKWRQQRPRAGKPWSPKEDEALLRELASGLSLEETARRLGRGVFAVEVRLTKLARGASVRSGRPNRPLG